MVMFLQGADIKISSLIRGIIAARAHISLMEREDLDSDAILFKLFGKMSPENVITWIQMLLFTNCKKNLTKIFADLCTARLLKQLRQNIS